MSERALMELLYGSGAHANALACVEDVEFELAGRQADHFPHSIWQLVNHMNFWMAYELRRIRGENPPYPTHASESWTAAPTACAAEEWQDTISLFRSFLAELANLAESPDVVLANEVPPT